MTTLFSGCDDVVVRDIAGEWSGQEVSPAQLCGDKELSGGAGELSSTASSHSIDLLPPDLRMVAVDA